MERYKTTKPGTEAHYREEQKRDAGVSEEQAGGDSIRIATIRARQTSNIGRFLESRFAGDGMTRRAICLAHKPTVTRRRPLWDLTSVATGDG